MLDDATLCAELEKRGFRVMRTEPILTIVPAGDNPAAICQFHARETDLLRSLLGEIRTLQQALLTGEPNIISASELHELPSRTRYRLEDVFTHITVRSINSQTLTCYRLDRIEVPLRATAIAAALRSQTNLDDYPCDLAVAIGSVYNGKIQDARWIRVAGSPNNWCVMTIDGRPFDDKHC